MRFIVAALLFITGVVTVLVGIAERTVWAPPAAHRLSIEIKTDNPLVLIPNEVLHAFVGNPVITVVGSQKVFVASGRQSDVEAWIGKTNHDSISFNPIAKQLVSKSVLGAELSANPTDSDLWRVQRSGTSQVSLLAKPDDSAGLLVASDGLSTAPRNLELVWRVVNDLGVSTFTLYVGTGFLVVGLILNLWSYQVMRKNRGPRRRLPKAPQGPKTRRKKSTNRIAPQRGRRVQGRTFIALPASIVLLGLLSGCSSSPITPVIAIDPSSQPAVDELPPPVVTSQQLKLIMTRVSKTTEVADKALDHIALGSRFIGPALAVRQAHYLLRGKGSKVQPLPTIFAKPISFSLPEASNKWPRQMMVVTDQSGDSALPQLVAMQQATPRSNYVVWYTVGLMPGATIPKAASPKVGAVPVEAGSLFLKLPPNQVAEAYGDVINLGSKSLKADLFNTAKDEFYSQVSLSQAAQIAKLKKAKINFSHKTGEQNILSLATLDAGALVALYMTDTYTIKPISATAVVSVSGDEKLLLGADGSASGIRSVYGDMLVFYVPALSDESRITLIGATQGLISVRGL